MSNRIIFITGQKGTGKTFLAVRLVKSLLENGRRVIVLDPHGEISLPGCKLTKSANDLGRLAGRSCLFVPSNDSMADALFRFVWFLQERPGACPVWLLVDELPMYLDGRRPSIELMRLVRYGRNRFISIIGTAQRPANVHNDFLANSDIKVCFRVQEVNDLAYLRRYIGPEADSLSVLPDRRYKRFL